DHGKTQQGHTQQGTQGGTTMTVKTRTLGLLGAMSALALVAAAGGAPSSAWAADPASCKEVNFADVGWTDITATTAATSVVLEGLPGNWMPTMEGDIAQYRDEGSVETVRANLEGAKYTLAVPKYTADKGLKDFADIAKFKDGLAGKIYGIEPGNDGNRLILDM